MLILASVSDLFSTFQPEYAIALVAGVVLVTIAAKLSEKFPALAFLGDFLKGIGLELKKQGRDHLPLPDDIKNLPIFNAAAPVNPVNGLSSPQSLASYTPHQNASNNLYAFATYIRSKAEVKDADGVSLIAPDVFTALETLGAVLNKLPVEVTVNGIQQGSVVLQK